ncbi:hypothetical protein IT570_10170 [Candidatus Sumerlaeota bacterium]|nr:hypothetical protein [Candidatus Sumerlaeota bacterium]
MKKRLLLSTLFAACASIMHAQDAPSDAAATLKKTEVPGVGQLFAVTQVPDTKAADRRQVLLSHGVNPFPADLMNFLQNGFSTASLPKGFPDKPVLKSEVLNAAIVELGLTGVTESVPILTQIAEQKLSPAALRIVERDFEQIPIDKKDSQVSLMKQVLSLNAITALGYIGDASAAPAVLEQIRAQVATSFTTKGAIALGLMGKSDGLPGVVLLASDPTSDDSITAFETIYILAGRNYGYTINTPLAKRRDLVKQMKEWFEKEGASIVVNRQDVLRRLDNPPKSFSDPGDTSIRGLLQRTVDVSNYDSRYAARESLMKEAKAYFDEMKTIAQDKNEELDVRRAAMQWLVISNPKKARSIIRAQQNDENKVIADMAQSLEREIDRAQEYEKATNR